MDARGRYSIVTFFLVALGASHLLTEQRTETENHDHGDWRVYGGGPDNIHYSTLNQINVRNVRDLKVAWQYDAGDASQRSEMECNPVVIDGILFATTASLRVIALDAPSGKLLWKFDPSTEGQTGPIDKRSRGLSYWADGNDRRLFFVAGPLL